MPFGLAASMNQLENCANQPTVAVSGIRGHNFGPTNGKGYAFICPLLSPKKGHTNESMFLSLRVFNHCYISGARHRVVAAQQFSHQIPHLNVRGGIGLMTENRTSQVSNILNVICSRPAQDEAITQFSSIMWIGSSWYCCQHSSHSS